MRQPIAFLVAACVLLFPSALGAGGKKKKNADTDQIGRRDITKGSWNLYSLEREVKLGEQVGRDAERTLHLLRDPVVTAYVTQVADRIIRHSDTRMPLQVRIVDSNEISAFALPGGFFFINTGLILETQSEAELASVIAHEVAHVAARHATKQMTKAQIINWLSLPLLLFGGPVPYAIHQGLALAVPLTFLKFSRNAEREADFLGLQYQYASGYDPVAFIDFFERVSRKDKESKGSIAKAFSTHPMTRERIVAAERTIEQYLPPREEYVVTTSRHDEIGAYLKALQSEWVAGLGNLVRQRDNSDWPAAKGKTQQPF